MFSYAWLWILGLIAVAVYGADTFTAINLLAYDKWSSQIEPAIPLKYSKWIFAVCIIISWALCIFEWVRAIRVIRRGSVAESYMDSLAVALQSMRPQGWKRFLVFAELTKSKKGVDYVALFVYFAFKGAVRIILAEGPRQVVNAITLYSFMQQDLIPTGDHAATADRSSFEQFWVNVESLAEADREQAVVLFTMLFTLVIWVISALCLIIAVVLYLLFLWHYIPQSDGRLSIYCRRKIDRRLQKIVGQKVKQALEEQEKKQAQDEAKAARKANQLPSRPQVGRKPMLPQVATQTPDLGQQTEFGLVRQDQRPPPTRTNTAPLPSIQRKPTMPDMARLEDRPKMPPLRNFTAPPMRTNTAPPMQLHRQPTLPDLDADHRPPMPYRSNTEASALSNITYASDASLLGNANDMGYDDTPIHYPTQPRPTFDRSASYASRQMPSAMDRQLPYASSRPAPSRSQTVPPQQPERQDEHWQYERDSTPSPTDMPPYPYGMPSHQELSEYDSIAQSTALPRQRQQQSHRPYTPLTHMGSGLSFPSRHTPSPDSDAQSYEMTEQPRALKMPEPFEQTHMPEPFEQQQQLPRSTSAAAGYVAFNPSFAPAPAPTPAPASTFTPPNRSLTSPPQSTGLPTAAAVLQRSATAPPEPMPTSSYDDLIEEYRVQPHVQPQYTRQEILGRSATAGPVPEGYRGQQYTRRDVPGRSATAGPVLGPVQRQRQRQRQWDDGMSQEW